MIVYLAIFNLWRNISVKQTFSPTRCQNTESALQGVRRLKCPKLLEAGREQSDQSKHTFLREGYFLWIKGTDFSENTIV